MAFFDIMLITAAKLGSVSVRAVRKWTTRVWNVG